MTELRPISMATKVRIDPQVAWRDLDGHVFAVTPDNRQHELAGGVESLVWHCLEDAASSVEDLTRRVTESFDVQAEVAGSDLLEFVTGCLDAKLFQIVE